MKDPYHLAQRVLRRVSHGALATLSVEQDGWPFASAVNLVAQPDGCPAVLISGLVQFGPARWGDGVYALAHALWWLDAAMALGSALLVPYLMFTRQSHALEKMTAVWLLPIVAPEVAAGAAGALAGCVGDRRVDQAVQRHAALCHCGGCAHHSQCGQCDASHLGHSVLLCPGIVFFAPHWLVGCWPSRG